MNTKEAIQAMLEGKKVRAIDWNKECYILFNGDMFVDEEGEHFSEFTSYSSIWEIYEEPKPVQTVTIEKWLLTDGTLIDAVETSDIVQYLRNSKWKKVKLIDTYEVTL